MVTVSYRVVIRCVVSDRSSPCVIGCEKRLCHKQKVSYGSLCTGFGMGWTSPVLPKLQNTTLSPLEDPVTPLQESWVGSLLLLGGIMGPIIAAPACEKIGRRFTILGSSLPLILGWILIGVATNLATIYAGRICWGIAVGIQFAIVPIYIGEIAEDEVRGALSSFFVMFINFGFLLAYVIGPYTSYWNIAIIGGVLSILYAGAFVFIPETPAYFITKGRIDDAAKSLAQLRGKTLEGIQDELNQLKTNLDKDYEQKPKISDLWATKGNIKALCMCSFLAMLLQLAGIDVLLFYMENLLVKMGTKMSPQIATIVIGLVQVISSCVTPLVIDRLGRRLLMWTTSLGLTICLTVIGIYAILDDRKYDVTSIGFLPILALVLYMIIFNLGVGPVPWVLVAEMFPPKSKCLAACICSGMCWIAGFIWTRFFGDMERDLGIYTAFWILALCCFIGFLFSIFMLPETKGKSFQEIQELLNKTEKTGHITQLGMDKIPALDMERKIT